MIRLAPDKLRGGDGGVDAGTGDGHAPLIAPPVFRNGDEEVKVVDPFDIPLMARPNHLEGEGVIVGCPRLRIGIIVRVGGDVKLERGDGIKAPGHEDQEYES